jgi:predicted dehydrogenase
MAGASAVRNGETVTWGVVGAGAIVRRAILPALTRAANARVLAVASADAQRAAALAADYGVPHGYGSYAALLDDPNVQCVYIGLPNALHREWTVRAAAAGKHVLCEKPLGLDAAEAEAMVAACEQAGVKLMEALMYRFHPRTARLGALLAADAFGVVRSVQTAFTFPLRDMANYRLRPEEGGGALLDVGGYGVSAVLAIIDEEPERVSAAAHYGATGVDLTLTGLLAFAGGAAATVTVSFEAAELQHITVLGSEAVVDVPLAFTAGHGDAAPILLQRGREIEEIICESADPYQKMVEAFGTAVLAGAAIPYPLTSTLATLRTLDALAQAAHTGQPQAL